MSHCLVQVWQTSKVSIYWLKECLKQGMKYLVHVGQISPGVIAHQILPQASLVDPLDMLYLVRARHSNRHRCSSILYLRRTHWQHVSNTLVRARHSNRHRCSSVLYLIDTHTHAQYIIRTETGTSP
jgi:hypothetical protein